MDSLRLQWINYSISLLLMDINELQPERKSRRAKEKLDKNG